MVSDRVSLLFKAMLDTVVYLYHILFIHLSVVGHLDFFCLLAIVHNVAMNLCLRVSVEIHAFNLAEYVLRSGIAISYCNSMLNILRHYHIVFHSD